jgi:hypothetical protein
MNALVYDSIDSKIAYFNASFEVTKLWIYFFIFVIKIWMISNLYLIIILN